ncbi:MAG TPA: hypothetical protein VIK72_01125 [Clostridiaceae bacterium]
MGSKIKNAIKLIIKSNVYKPMKILAVIFIVLVIISTIVYNNKTIFTSELSKVNSYPDINTGNSQISYSTYDNYDKADKIVATIITGTVIKVYPVELIKDGEITNFTTGEVTPVNNPYIVSDIKVDKVMKGNYKTGDIIKVKQAAGNTASIFFKLANKYLFFLVDYHDATYSWASEAPVSVINPFQGSIPITKGKVEKFGDLQFIKAGVSEKKLITQVKRKILKLKISNKK